MSFLTIGGSGLILFILQAKATPTIATDPLNPFLWADHAETTQNESDFLEAVNRGPNVPPILIRTANFYVARNDYPRALPYLMRILALTQAYNGVIFNYFLRSGLPPASLIPADPKQSRAFLYHLMATRHENANFVYAELTRRKAVTSEIFRDWINYLFASKKYQEANKIWRNSPSPNLISNPSFSEKFSGAVLDWQLQKHDHVEVDLNPGFRLRFDGTENTNYANLTQAIVLSPGPYTLTVDWESERISTNEGVFVRVSAPALEVQTEALLGNHARHITKLPVQVPPGAHYITVTIARKPSLRFDNKIQGSVWIHEIKLTTGS